MRKNRADLQVAENNRNKVLDMEVIPASYSSTMKPKRQTAAFNLRLTKRQKEAVRRAAESEGRSMHNYILRVVLAKAASDLQTQAKSAVDSLAS